MALYFNVVSSFFKDHYKSFSNKRVNKLCSAMYLSSVYFGEVCAKTELVR